ncbi:LOW QUALITY PROTEIN: hypothetical protein PHMEG_00013104 [Phytophthora megakarya]|uniref:Retrotransposon gag domain-containing protein n=1 Tax=Phytophthora megakarya TaxID=4795 RepID=A0A225W974_9STRA|nr:LOW QUALITY PROTEIN: hypothetical protein PHMEG_00013104 [Phytophthora megakarya]
MPDPAIRTEGSAIGRLSCELDEYEPSSRGHGVLVDGYGHGRTRLPVVNSPRRLDRVGSRHLAAAVETEIKTEFESKDVGAGRQPVARSAGERVHPANIPLSRTPKKTAKAVFGSAEQSPYFHDSHMVTPRSENLKAHVAREEEQTESTANTRPCTGRNSWRRQAPAGDSSSDESNPFCQDDDENKATTDLAWQIRELAVMKEMDPTPRFEIAQHRPLGKITPFRGRLDESENSTQWLRGFVHTPPNEWCMAFQLSLRDGAIHWYQALSRKTKRSWSLLSDKFISYYCSQFGQSASTRYYRVKRSEKEHIRDYLNRLNGYARSANIKSEHSGREAKEHLKHFLETSRPRATTYFYLRNIHTLEDIVSDIQKVEKRVSNRSCQSSSRRDDKRHSSLSGNYGRHDSRSRSQERSRSDHATLHTRASSERPTSTRTTTRMMSRSIFIRVMTLTKMSVTVIVGPETRSKVRILVPTKTRN